MAESPNEKATASLLDACGQLCDEIGATLKTTVDEIVASLDTFEKRVRSWSEARKDAPSSD